MKQYVAVMRGIYKDKSYEAPREWQVAMQLMDKWWVRVLDYPHDTKISVIAPYKSQLEDIAKEHNLRLCKCHDSLFKLFVTGVFRCKKQLPIMKKIFIMLPSGKYLIGYSTSLRLYLSSISEDIDITNAMKQVDTDLVTSVVVYHKGHGKDVQYIAENIRENERCFLKVQNF